MDDITIRPVTPDEYPAFVEAFMDGFSEDLPSKTFPEMIRKTLPPERTLAAFDGDVLVGTFGGYDLLLTVPGGTVRMEGTTVVTVSPTHRRLGLASAMMTEHLDNAAAQGYPVAGLWASESGIYGRYGYGIATYCSVRRFDGTKVAFRDGISIERTRRVTLKQAADLLPDVYGIVCAATPGMFERSTQWWANEVLLDEDWMKRGKTSVRIVVHDGPDGVDGYAIYRQKGGELDDGHANGTVFVEELTADTPGAKASLWSYLVNVDGCPNVRFGNRPVDDDIAMMVREPRRIETTTVFDGLWLRILDVEAALGKRTYEQDGTLVFHVVDSYRPETEGAYRLSVADGVGVCQRTDQASDVDLDVDVLGALYLGGGDVLAYGAAGRIRGSDADILRLHHLFATAKKPWCNQVF